jgi:Zn-dependent protease with chaperone function
MNDRASKLKGLVWVFSACLLGGGFATGLTPLAHIVPWSWEKGLGASLESGMGPRVCRAAPQARQALDKLVKRIYPLDEAEAAFPLDVAVVRNEEVNAYAALGGQLFLNDGALRQAQAPEEIAGVLAHEIGHIRRRHVMQRVLSRLLTSEGIKVVIGAPSKTGDWADYFMTMGFSRDQEAEADQDALQRLQKARVDNRGLKNFLKRAETPSMMPSFFLDHPSNDSRLEAIEAFPNASGEEILSAGEWKNLQKYCAAEDKKGRK